MKNFMIARGKDGSIIGVVGVEMYQESGLLRSLVVHPAYRGTGLGSLLTRKIESFALHNGVKTLYLLTMISADFFQRIGYEVMFKNHLTHRDIASLTGTSRQTVTTLLNELKDVNLINFDRRRFLIRDMDKLK